MAAVEGPRGASSPPAPRAPGLRRRLACLAYEGILMFGVVFVAGLLYAVLTGQRHALTGRHGLALFAFFLTPAVYFIGYWRSSGQTLPMQTWQLRLVTKDGQRLGPVRAAARFLAAWVWLLPPLLLASVVGAASLRWMLLVTAGWVVLYALSSKLHRSGQFWHDVGCGTQLVDTRPDATA